MILTIILGILFAILCLGVVLGIIFLLSKVIVNAAPFSMAALIGLAHGWPAFFFWLVLLYALASYPKLRKAVIFVSISLVGVLIPTLLNVIIGGIFSPWVTAFLKLIVVIGCAFLAMRIDAEKEKAFCINVAKVLPLPVVAERILMSFIYGCGSMLAIVMCFADIVQSPAILNIVSYVALIAVFAAVFIVDTKYYNSSWVVDIPTADWEEYLTYRKNK